MKRSLTPIVALLLMIGLLVIGCSRSAPAPAPTSAPAAPKAPAAASTAAPAAAPTQAAAAAPAKAAFPEAGKPITFIVPFSAGGSTDIAARTLAPYLEKELGVPVNIVNKPGAGSQIGLTEMTQSKPDGYTIAYANLPGPITIYLNPDRKATFTKKDFAPIAMHLINPGAVAVKADGPYQSMKDLVDAAKANPGGIKAATTGLLSDDHLAILNVANAAGVKFAIVHFDGNLEILRCWAARLTPPSATLAPSTAWRSRDR